MGISASLQAKANRAIGGWSTSCSWLLQARCVHPQRLCLVGQRRTGEGCLQPDSDARESRRAKVRMKTKGATFWDIRTSSPMPKLSCRAVGHQTFSGRFAGRKLTVADNLRRRHPSVLRTEAHRARRVFPRLRNANGPRTPRLRQASIRIPGPTLHVGV